MPKIILIESVLAEIYIRPTSTMIHLKTFSFLASYPVRFLVNYFIAWFDRKVNLRFSFPRDVDELKTKREWCVIQLKKSKALPETAIVTSYQVNRIKQETIFRSNAGIIEICYSESGESKTLKCFAKFAPNVGSIINRTTFNLQLNHVKESNFNRYFIGSDSNIPAPKVFFTDCSPVTGNLCLITEMMSDCVEYMEGVYLKLTDAHLRLALDGLASLHAAYWKENSERMKFIGSVSETIVHFFESTVRATWSNNARKILTKSWLRMNRAETILHGDSRIGNMLFPSQTGNGRFVFIDWQAARKGKAAYDLAYFLTLSLTTLHRKEEEMKCVERYFQLLQAKGVKDYSWQEMLDDYHHACLCVLVLLSLPGLSGEASVEGYGAEVFVYGMNIWRLRLQSKFENFDFGWLEKNYGINEKEGRDAIAEMLITIETRLKKTVGNEVFEKLRLALPKEI